MVRVLLLSLVWFSFILVCLTPTNVDKSLQPEYRICTVPAYINRKSAFLSLYKFKFSMHAANSRSISGSALNLGANVAT